MERYIDLSGKRFGKLLVEKIDHKEKKNNTTRIYWKCLCDCGKTHIVRSDSLTSGSVKSCGCLYKEKEGSVKNLSRSRLYKIHDKIIQRCYNKNNNRFKDYGGRGITVYNEWKNDFLCFYNWALENGYKDNLTIDRIDVNGNYEPKNCRWISNYEQQRNKRTNVFIEIDGKTMCVKDWCKKINKEYRNLWNISKKDGLSYKEVLIRWMSKKYNFKTGNWE